MNPDGTGGLSRQGRLVKQAMRHGVSDAGVLAAMAQVPRDIFVPEELAESAFEDTALPIGEGQTISQPAMVALMAEAARISPDDRILEIGAGSGYGAAMLRTLANSVTTMERNTVLAERARTALSQCGFDDVAVVVGDGTLGCPEGAPYDAIVVTAAGPSAPPPLIEQLSDTGCLVMPIGPKSRTQHLMRFTLRHVGSGRHADSRADRGASKSRAHGQRSDCTSAKRSDKHGDHENENRLSGLRQGRSASKTGSKILKNAKQQIGKRSKRRSSRSVGSGSGEHTSELRLAGRDVRKEQLMPVRFVPLIGKHGF